MIARVFCSGQGCISFIRHTEGRKVGIPVMPNVGPFSGLSRLDIVPGAFGISLPRRLIIRTVGYGSSGRTHTLNVR